MPEAITQPLPRIVDLRAHVLVIDSDDHRRALTHKILTRAGFGVLIATSCTDALHMARVFHAGIELVIGDTDIGDTR